MALSDLTRTKYTAAIIGTAAAAGFAFEYAPPFFQGLFVGIFIGFVLFLVLVWFERSYWQTRPTNRELSAPVNDPGHIQNLKDR
ncbi:MAG TPA: hypothetical protein VJL90_05815 [Pseudorhodoplanes sp.]|nr:hypothetical protein [Pseudorhodoplanes sp.]